MCLIKRKRVKNTFWCKKDYRFHDKVEKSKEYKKYENYVNEKADKMALEELGSRCIGFCHLFWIYKRKILKDEFNIIWRSPAEVNPNCKFD